jgi:hypothetical protein
MPRATGKRNVAAPKTSGFEEIDGQQFAWRDAIIRGERFHLVEIDGDAYEKILKLSVLPGSDGERIDLNLQYKLMLAKSCQSPKLTAVEIGAMPFRKRRALLSEVVVLHFGDEEEDGGEDEGEGKESSSED